MDESRINFKAFKWAAKSGNNRCKKWYFRLKQKFAQSNIANLFYDRSDSVVAKDYVKQKFKKKTIHNEYIIRWHNELERNLSRSGLGGNKLRTY